MGWRERDWAKLREDERRALWGSPERAGGDASTSAGHWFNLRAGAGCAVLVSAGLFVAGQLPRGHPLFSALHFKLPAINQAAPPAAADSSHRVVHMRGPRAVPSGAVMTSRGTLDPAVSGPLLVHGRWGRGRWLTLGSAYVKKGAYLVRYRLVRRGVADIRISFPDGTFAVSRIRVR